MWVCCVGVSESGCVYANICFVHFHLQPHSQTSHFEILYGVWECGCYCQLYLRSHFVSILNKGWNNSYLKSTRTVAGISRVVRPGSRRGVHVCVGVSRKGVVPEVGVVDDNFPFSFQRLSIYTCNHIPRPFILKTMKVCVLCKTRLLQSIQTEKVKC